MTDIADAARRVAESIRSTGYGNYCHPADLLALLPVLDAVAAGQGDEGREERWARLLSHQHFDRKQCVGACTKAAQTAHYVNTYWDRWKMEARAAIALADAEMAAGAKHFSASVMHEALAAAGLPVEAVRPIDGAAIGHALKAILAEHPDKVKQARVNPTVRGWVVGKVMAACRGLLDPAFVAELVDTVLDAAARRSAGLP